MTNITSFPVHSLHASDGTKLTKTKDSSYPHIKNFTSKEHSITKMEDLFKVIKAVATEGGCLLKGFLNRPLINESRAGSTNSDDMTVWMVFDLDGANYKTPAAFVKDLPAEFQNITYIQQFSASAGDKPGLRCHLFFHLHTPIYASILKTYLQHLNISIKTLKSGIELSKVGVALKWPLDITVCQNDKLIYIAPPDYKTKFAGTRIRLIKGRSQTVKIDFSIVSKESIDDICKKLVNQLRKNAKLPTRRKFEITHIHNAEILKNPGEALVTGHRLERGFHYLNLNGGDSWGYYHKEGHNDVLYNFKSEPNYLIKELIPEYYEKLTQTSDSSNEPLKGVEYIAVCDPKTDMYYRGYYDPNLNEMELNTTTSMTKVHHFLKSHGLQVPDFIPEWHIKCDFHSSILYDKQKKVINLYQDSKYLKEATKVEGPPTSIPPNISKLLDHIFNYQDTVREHFLNWLAYIIQTKKQTGTAWILHGTQGTGKGILFNKIITPILGKPYSFRTTLPTFETEFNGFMETSLIILIDETQISEINKKSQAMSNLKQLITDSLVSIRRMRTDPYVVENHASFLIFSNKYDAIQIDANDRRMNVAPRQEVPLLKRMTGAEIDAIQHEIQDFATYLFLYSVDATKVGTILQTEERARLQELTQDSGEEVAERLRAGDLNFFIENAPDHEDTMAFELKSGFGENNGPPTYKELMNLLIRHRGEPINLTRDELRVLYYYLNNLVWATPHKFTKYAGHKGLKIETVDVKGTSHRGIRGLVFKCDDITIKNWQKKHKPKTTNKKIRRIK